MDLRCIFCQFRSGSHLASGAHEQIQEYQYCRQDLHPVHIRGNGGQTSLSIHWAYGICHAYVRMDVAMHTMNCAIHACRGSFVPEIQRFVHGPKQWLACMFQQNLLRIANFLIECKNTSRVQACETSCLLACKAVWDEWQPRAGCLSHREGCGFWKTCASNRSQ
jgi:hypothetical protein